MAIVRDIVVASGGSVALTTSRLGGAPDKRKVGKSKKVRFTVTDADDRVAGVKVKGGGKSCITKASGKCTAKLKPSKPGKVIIKAKKKGYGAARATLKAKK